jgi:hypothetical protein
MMKCFDPKGIVYFAPVVFIEAPGFKSVRVPRNGQKLVLNQLGSRNNPYPRYVFLKEFHDVNRSHMQCICPIDSYPVKCANMRNACTEKPDASHRKENKASYPFFGIARNNHQNQSKWPKKRERH